MRVTGASWIERMSLLIACTGMLLLPALAQANERRPVAGLQPLYVSGQRQR
jgi:phospholipid-binding lipoprotein MlaA